jgi:hypothetical protein
MAADLWQRGEQVMTAPASDAAGGVLKHCLDGMPAIEQWSPTENGSGLVLSASGY